MTHVAIGDPQASLATFLGVLRQNQLLTPQDRLRPGVHLVSLGDHFDFGRPDARLRSAADGEGILAWLADHSPQETTLLLGNHDLARVCELFPFADDAQFAAAHAEARQLYEAGAPEDALLARYPWLPDAECVARDYACFRTAQRELVSALLRQGRFRLAAHHHGLLLVHAGVTLDDLALLGIAPDSAEQVAHALNAFLDARVQAWREGPLDLAPLHLPGSGAGEGVGALYHRPADPSEQPNGRFSTRRRYDPRRLPTAFPQVIGHIRDGKCRELMPRWSADEPARDGPLRSLVVQGDAVRYGQGCAPDARLLFADGGMSHLPPGAHYELLDLQTRRAYVPAA